MPVFIPSVPCNFGIQEGALALGASSGCSGTSEGPPLVVRGDLRLN